ANFRGGPRWTGANHQALGAAMDGRPDRKDDSGGAEPSRLGRSAEPIFAEVHHGPERIIRLWARPWMAARIGRMTVEARSRAGLAGRRSQFSRRSTMDRSESSGSGRGHGWPPGSEG